jgi:LmbE family N-acetylglucosaminyl deacetylase
MMNSIWPDNSPQESGCIITLVPHPDDEALGCSGTLLQLHKKSGTSSSIIFLTSGEKLYVDASSEIAEKRKEEARRSSEMLGCGETLFLDFPDGEIRGHREAIYQKLHGIIEERKPHIVLSPSPIDYHDDHIATSHIALRLLNTFHTFSLVFYEVYSTLRFNALVDITEVAEEKKKIILNYHVSLCEKTQLYVSAALGLNAQRSMFVQKDGYYEAFYIVEENVSLGTICDYLSYRDFNTNFQT